MTPNPPDPAQVGAESNETKIARLEEQLNHKNELVTQKISEVDKISRELTAQRKENKQKTEEITELKIAIAKKDAELEHKKPKFSSRVLAVCISLFFGVSNILFNLANSLLTNKPPDTGSGTIILYAAIFLYVVCAIVTVFMLGGN